MELYHPAQGINGQFILASPLRIESVRRWSNLVLLLPSDEITPNRLSTPISALRRTLSQARGMAMTPLDTGTRAL